MFGTTEMQSRSDYNRKKVYVQNDNQREAHAIHGTNDDDSDDFR